MKFLLCLTAFLILFSCRENATSGEDPTSGVDTTSVVGSAGNSPVVQRGLQSIDDIRTEYSYISSKIASGSMDSVSFNYNCRGEKSGEVTYFSENGEPRLIRHTYSEYSHFSATDEYYLKDAEPFFVFYDHLAWSFVDQNQTRDEVTEKRFYIIDNKPVKCLQKEFTILSDAENPPESTRVPSEEIECSSLEPVLEDFELLFKLRHQEEDLDCLQEQVPRN